MIPVVYCRITQEMPLACCVPIIAVLNIWRILHVGANIHIIALNCV
jgi:hypothetical protein